MTYPAVNGTQAESGPRLIDGDFVNGNGLAGGHNRTARQISALAGGAAPTGSLSLLASAITEVNVVTSVNDSVQLPSAQGNQIKDVINSSANAMRVYSSARTPADTINGTAGTTPVVVAAGKSIRFVSSVQGKWFGNLSA